MENRSKIFVKAEVVFIVSLFVALTASAMASPFPKAFFSSTRQTMHHGVCSSDETELKYYEEEGLSTVIGACNNGVWKTAIRLTQDEMAAYSDWTMTKVNVAFSADNGCPYIYVRIYVFDKGATSTKPGPIIVDDTIAKLDTTGITTIPLVTPVNLSGHEELWVAVEWNDTWDIGYYAWLDTVTGPHVPQKGDWYYLNNAWGEVYIGGADYDGNWGIGAIIEGLGAAKLAIGNITGPLGITADVRNIGETNATNINWSINVTGGLFKRVNTMVTGTMATLAPGASFGIRMGLFFGFGKILIVISVKAQNALEITVKMYGFLCGPFVLQIK
jgi:hypothetical protein